MIVISVGAAQRVRQWFYFRGQILRNSNTHNSPISMIENITAGVSVSLRCSATTP